jgi:hypothetical protein
MVDFKRVEATTLTFARVRGLLLVAKHQTNWAHYPAVDRFHQHDFDHPMIADDVG